MSRGTRDGSKRSSEFRVRAYYPLWSDFPDTSTKQMKSLEALAVTSSTSHNPVLAKAATMAHNTVWAEPRSLAATEGIAIAF